jgi:hypothetical protein
MTKSTLFILFLLMLFQPAGAQTAKRLVKHEGYYNDTLIEYTDYFYKSYYGYNPTYDLVFDKDIFRESHFRYDKPSNNLYDSAVLHNITISNAGNITSYLNVFDHFHRPVLLYDSSSAQQISYRTQYEYTPDDRVLTYVNYSVSKWGMNGQRIAFEKVNEKQLIARMSDFYKNDSQDVMELFLTDTFRFENKRIWRHSTNFMQVQNSDYDDYFTYDDRGLLKNYISYRHYPNGNSAVDRSASYTYNKDDLIQRCVSPQFWHDSVPMEECIYFYNQQLYPDSMHYNYRDQYSTFYYVYDANDLLIEKTTVYVDNGKKSYTEKFYYEPYYSTSRESADGLDDFNIVSQADEDEIVIKANLNLASDIRLYLYSMDGHIVYSTYLSSSSTLNHRIPTNACAQGIYFVKVNTQTGSRVQKILIH